MQGERTLRPAGLTNMTGNRGTHIPGEAIREMGGARVGRDPNSAVLDGWTGRMTRPISTSPTAR